MIPLCICSKTESIFSERYDFLKLWKKDVDVQIMDKKDMMNTAKMLFFHMMISSLTTDVSDPSYGVFNLNNNTLNYQTFKKN